MPNRAAEQFEVRCRRDRRSSVCQDIPEPFGYVRLYRGRPSVRGEAPAGLVVRRRMGARNAPEMRKSNDPRDCERPRCDGDQVTRQAGPPICATSADL